MSSQVEVHAGSTLAIRPQQADWTPEQAQALLEMFNLNNAPHPVIRSYFHVCQTTGLDPFKRQIHLIERQGKFTPQTSIDGFRIIRDRSGVYDGDETLWCGPDGVWVDAWLKEEPPTACKFVLYVKGRSKPVTAVARWSEYVQTKRDGTVTSMWKRMAAHMLAKVAEALAIRKAFPDDTGGLYTDDEMMQAEVVHDAPARKGSPGLLDLDEPPVASPAAPSPSTTEVGGGFMQVDENVVDAEVVEDDPQPETASERAETTPVTPQQPEPAPEPAPAPENASTGGMMDMAPEPDAPLQYAWSARLTEFVEQNRPLGDLHVFYQEAQAANALGEPVPWFGQGATLVDAIFGIKANLEAGKPHMGGV